MCVRAADSAPALSPGHCRHCCASTGGAAVAAPATAAATACRAPGSASGPRRRPAGRAVRENTARLLHGQAPRFVPVGAE